MLVPHWRMKREQGKGFPHALAVPATVGGLSLYKGLSSTHWRALPGRDTNFQKPQARRPASIYRDDRTRTGRGMPVGWMSSNAVRVSAL